MATSRENDGFREVEPDNIKAPPHYREGRSQNLTPDTGRQGPSGIRVLVVLLASMAGVVALWIIFMAAFRAGPS
jgi:hypothetical protein